MHHVCLIQSISARKATHIKLGTRSGSYQCQLHFGTKMVSIGWSGCEWLSSVCKNAHFQAFPPLAPSVKLPYQTRISDCHSRESTAPSAAPPALSSEPPEGQGNGCKWNATQPNVLPNLDPLPISPENRTATYVQAQLPQLPHQHFHQSHQPPQQFQGLVRHALDVLG